MPVRVQWAWWSLTLATRVACPRTRVGGVLAAPVQVLHGGLRDHATQVVIVRQSLRLRSWDGHWFCAGAPCVWTPAWWAGSHQPGQVAHVHSVSLGFRGPLRAYARWCFVHRENLYAATDSVSRMVNVRGKNNLCDIMHEAEFSTNGSRQTCPHM